MNIKLDHIAIAVADLGRAVEAFEAKLGLPCQKIEEVPEQSAKVAFFDLGAVHLELVSPLDPGSPLGRSIEKRGEGLHHLCFEVPGLEEAIRSMTERGVQLATQPTAGAGGSRVAFLHPKSMSGVLVELVEKPSSTC
jgi:methylmalonyl-CoA/ethylmalonyl-CoA epimerase